MEPGIVADLRAFWRIVRQPADDRVLGDRAIFEQRTVHLIAHLHGIAAIDEDSGADTLEIVGQHRRAASRAAKPGQPLQALGIGTDIFADWQCVDEGKSVSVSVNCEGRRNLKYK